MSPTPQPLAKRILVLQIIVAALGLQVMMLLFLTKQAVERNAANDQLPASIDHPSTPLFGVLSLALVFAAIMIPHILMKKAAQPISGARPPADPLPAIFRANIIRFVLFETVGILGFIVGSASRDMNYSHIAFGVTIAAYAIFFPTPAAVAKFLPRVPGQPNPTGV